MADKKLLFILFSWSLLWVMMAGRIPGAHSTRLKLQSTHATLYGGPDASATLATSLKPAPTLAPIINDDKKEDINGENDSTLLVMCGYPCCGTGYHGPCSRCCPKGPHDVNDVEEAANGGDGVGHVGGDEHN